MTTFFSELKRRNVLRVAAAYAVVAWIIIEAGSVLLPTFGAPESAFQAYVLVVLAGFVASLVLSWVLEVTPEGVRLEKNVDREESVTARTGRKLNVVTIALLIIALIVSVTLNVTGIRNPDPVPAADRPSIAVLPFESLSTDPENELFADGIHDDLLTRLANIGALKVISRTSVMEYRHTKKNLRQIAADLGVSTVLEGAVQRVGDHVRINAQLIDAATDAHLWAKSYDRPFSVQNIFAIQSEISEEIAVALKATLTTEEHRRLANVPTENIDAYNLYMHGRSNLHKRRLETLLQARKQFEQATRLDPDYAEAYAGLADSVLLLFNNHAAIPREEALAVAEAALDKALSLNPDLADAYASLGLLKHKKWDETRTGPGLAEAEAAYRRAIELNPNHPRAYMWFATARSTERRFEEAIELYQQAMRVDPLGRIPYANLPSLYAQMGRNDEALDLYVKALGIHPDWPTAYLGLSQHLHGLGRFDEAIAWGMRGQELSTDPLAGALMVVAFVEFGDYEGARNVLSDIPTEHPFYDLGDGINRMMDQDFAGAVAAFEEVVANSDNPRQFLFNIIATCAVLAEDYDKAREYTERGNPAFVADAHPDIDFFNIASIIQYAFVLQKQGEKQRAATLLTAALPVVWGLPRVGLAGHGIRDVQILALQGKAFEALAALREAIDDGFRGTVYSNGWPLSLDPYLDSIRNRPEFQVMASEIDAEVDLMQERAAQAETSGSWAGLIALVDSG